MTELEQAAKEPPKASDSMPTLRAERNRLWAVLNDLPDPDPLDNTVSDRLSGELSEAQWFIAESDPKTLLGALILAEQLFEWLHEGPPINCADRIKRHWSHLSARIERLIGEG